MYYRQGKEKKDDFFNFRININFDINQHSCVSTFNSFLLIYFQFLILLYISVHKSFVSLLVEVYLYWRIFKTKINKSLLFFKNLLFSFPNFLLIVLLALFPNHFIMDSNIPVLFERKSRNYKFKQLSQPKKRGSLLSFSLYFARSQQIQRQILHWKPNYGLPDYTYLEFKSYSTHCVTTKCFQVFLPVGKERTVKEKKGYQYQTDQPRRTFGKIQNEM